MNPLKQVMKHYWGYDEFRPLQEEAMEAVFTGRDSLVVMPTGGGKSLCFQVPALASDGMAVVVSPLISLMKDQVDFLESCGAPAACIHSGLNGAEKRAIDERLRAQEIKILYVAPERLASPAFIQYLRNVDLSFFAIDEAHCISHWGHDFRPSYRELRELKRSFDGIPVHAYTATATTPVRQDIQDQLGLSDPESFVGDFDRPNLTYSVLRQNDMKGQVLDCVARHAGESGIVYCPSRKKVEDMADFLVDSGHSALPYHAGMGDFERKRNQEAFTRSETDIIVATVAFGMGIDKPDVRFVFHAGMPKSIEHYQQEAGRAGRDGLPSECVLAYSKADHGFWRRLLANLEDEVYESAVSKLNEMLAYCTQVQCRHQRLVEYFGQPFSKTTCDACDVCLDEVDCHEDSLPITMQVLECVGALGDIAGPSYTTLVLSGSDDERVRTKRHNELPVWGALATHRQADVRDWVEQLVGQGFLHKQGEYNILSVTDKGQGVFSGEHTPRLLKPAPKKAKAQRAQRKKTWEGVDMVLVDRLRAKRLELAQERGKPAFVIFGDATLRDMAQKRPRNYDDLLNVQGIGEKKCNDFGGTFLEVIKDYLESSSNDRDQALLTPKPGKAENTKARVFDGFADGLTPSDIAMRHGMTEAKAFKLLLEFISERDVLDSWPWVSHEDRKAIGEAVIAVGTARRKTLYDYLGGIVDVQSLDIVLACLRNEGLNDPED
jgi:ATP-dependent DNA helicase RecQ